MKSAINKYSFPVWFFARRGLEFVDISHVQDMILIFSSTDDPTINRIREWIRNEGMGVYIIDPSRRYRIANLQISKDVQHYDFEISESSGLQGELNYSEIEAVFLWRGEINISFSEEISEKFANDSISTILKSFIRSEMQVLKEYIYFLLSLKPSLTTHFNTEVNKLVVLQHAVEIGLKIPETIVTSNKDDLKIFYEKNNESVITKSMGSIFRYYNEGTHYYSYTQLVNGDDITNMSSDHIYSLYQKKINKEFEIRIVYLDGETYAMAIHSQDDAQTQIDFRNYNDRAPNRTEPFELPNDIVSKIRKLMDKLHLKFGSIDMIYDVNGEFVFLEVNPVGQVGMVSVPCNYLLERKIAKYLVQMAVQTKQMV